MIKEKIRQQVSEAYTKAITSLQPSCCGTASRCGCLKTGTDSETELANLAGYSKEEIQILPEAAGSSFGCGNPLAYSEVKEGDVVLDLGSGAGFDLLLASKKVGVTGKVIGVDMTDAMIAKARQNLKKAGTINVEVRKGLIEELPVESSSVDWVISNCVINLSPEKSKVFSEIFRVLKPGGRILISDIVAEELPLEIRQSSMFYNSCVAGAISEKDYIAGLKKAGLEKIQVKERLVYETSQIKAFSESEKKSLVQNLYEKESEPKRQEMINKFIDQIAGKIWSAKFTATKPQ